MAIQWMDDFTSYGTDSSRVGRMSNGIYADNAWLDLVADPDPTAGGKYVLTITGNSTSSIRKTLPAAVTTVGVAARYWFGGLPSVPGKAGYLAVFSDMNNQPHVSFRVNPSGYIEVYRADTGGDVLIGTTTAPVINSNAWRHIEIKVLISATAGTVDIRQEGYTALSLSGIRTSSNAGAAIVSCQNVKMWNEYTAPTMYVKDFIIWDGTTANNNNFLGTCQVYKIVPNADVALNWTPNSGSVGYSKINDTTPDDDTGYIAAPSPPPAAFQASMTQLPANVTAVKGVMILHRSRKIDGGDGNIQASLISGASTGNGTDRPITTAYTYWSDVFDQDPSAVGWTRTLVNALKLKLNRTV